MSHSRSDSKRLAVLEAYKTKPITSRRKPKTANPDVIRTLSPYRFSPQKKFEHVPTIAFGGKGHSPQGLETWWTGPPSLAGEASSPAQRRLSDARNYTASYQRRSSYPKTAELDEIIRSHSEKIKPHEALEYVKVRKWLPVDRHNPEEKANYTATTVLLQSLRST